MKKYFLTTFILIFIMAPIFSQNVRVWKRLYNKAQSVKEKRNKVEQMYRVADESFKRFVIEILDEQVSYGTVKNKLVKKDYEQWIAATVKIVAKLKIAESVERIKKVLGNIDTPLTLGQIYLDMAKTENKELIPWFNRLLYDFNLQHSQGGTVGKEPIIDGMIQALAVFNDPSSFPYVFYVAMPNYEERIRNRADQLLKNISNDPAPLCKEIILEEQDKNVRMQALKYGYESESSNEDKADMAIAALFQEVNIIGEKDAVQKLLKKEVEDLAIQYIKALKTTNPNAVKAIEAKWFRDRKVKNIRVEDTNHMINMVEALQSIATDDAVILLTTKLAYFNEKVSADFGTGYGEKEGQK
ncbi:MAG: hypothetical protein MJB14_12215, partial [Spirochaetes bacterium]|nr:hypothetical protein [Spirochaetota bacterium]